MAPRKTFKRKANYKKKNTGIAKKALRKVNILAKKLKPEVKYVDIKSSPEDYGMNGIVYNITKFVAPGVGQKQRIGRQIRLLRLTGTMQLELATGVNSGGMRFLIVKGNNEDRKDIKVAETTSTSNEIPLLADVDQWPYVSRKVDDDSKRTRFIYDKKYQLDNGTKRLMTYNINFKLGWNTQYMIGDISEIQDGGLYVAGMMNSNATMTSLYNFRLWYTDV